MNGVNVGEIKKECCTGCKMCADICPAEAISFHSDIEGFWYPQIDSQRCVSCGKCSRTCPTSIEKQNDGIKLPMNAYASWNKNDDERRKATSGGVFPAIADEIISRGGFVIGSAYADDFKSAYHMVASDKHGVNKLKGSKYFQSDTEHIYHKTKECLGTNKEVLFVGTPCQVAALYEFLGERPDNLLTVDFICRGVSSPLLQKLKIEYYEKKGKSKVVNYRDKYKNYAWIDFGSRILYENGKERFISRWRDEILHFFIAKNLNIRPSCYKCQFKLGNMKSDITMGDFWRIEGVTEKDLRNGVSALMVNTTKGAEYIESIRRSLYLSKRPIEKVCAGNPAYTMPPDRPKEREMFFDDISEGGWEKALSHFKTFRAETDKQKRQHEKRMRQRPYLFLKDERKEINWKDFIHYNFFCDSVVREKGAFLVPYKGAVIDIHPDAKVYLKANACINYAPYYPRGAHMATFQVRRGAAVYINNRLELGYDAMLSVAENARFESGFFMPRMGSNVICRYSMKIGENVGIGRGSCVMDSDFHPIFNEKFEQINPDKEIVIEDDVWMGIQCTVTKGTHVGHGAVIGTGSFVSGNIPPEKILINKREKDCNRDVFYWHW